ncbi:MAG: alpha/beta fold hydrolase [Actinomycetota bacterium]|nr:alpha/beta fold hydrolase [Actinomycetota bacterium]
MNGQRCDRADVLIAASSGDPLHSWLYLPDAASPLPAVVMAHGIGGIKAAGLAPFAEHFAAAGFAVVVFDYRHWGHSGGKPRELLEVRRQCDDYRTVLRWAADHPGIDPSRLFAWGTSFAGMHILELAATETLAGAIAQCPLVDGLAGMRNVPIVRSLRLTVMALADKLGAAIGRRPIYVPVSVPPGSFGLIATNDAITGLERLAPDVPDEWPNRITARSVLDITRHRPVRRADQAQCPLLVVVAQEDTMAPVAPALRCAVRAPRGELYRSRGGHYDVYEGGRDHRAVLDVETAFMTRLTQPTDPSS